MSQATGKTFSTISNKNTPKNASIVYLCRYNANTCSVMDHGSTPEWTVGFLFFWGQISRLYSSWEWLMVPRETGWVLNILFKTWQKLQANLTFKPGTIFYWLINLLGLTHSVLFVMKELLLQCVMQRLAAVNCPALIRSVLVLLGDSHMELSRESRWNKSSLVPSYHSLSGLTRDRLLFLLKN